MWDSLAVLIFPLYRIIFLRDAPHIASASSSSAIITGVSLQVAAHQTEGYQINTPVYEGPLDLLLQLIEHAELDITTVALAQVTDQFLVYLRTLQQLDATEVSAFLVIAARLIQIKSTALLPKPIFDFSSQEEDLGEALAQQLILYKRFKELAAELAQREAAGLHTFLRVAAPPSFEPKLDLTGLTLADLLNAAQEVFNHGFKMPISDVVNMPRITIREKINVILDELRKKGDTTFRSIFSKRPSRAELVITFLAMLELIKRHIIEAQQPVIFEDIQMHTINEWNDQENVELEFGE
jgi:segregation and condensation protein A